jgi:hypothetical protein
MNMSLLSIMREDPDLARRIEQGTKEVRQTKATLHRNAAEIGEIYHKEIEEGTRQRQLLLTEGKAQGKDEATVLKEYGVFIPSKATPIMNFLYFFMRDGNRPDWLHIQQDLNNTYGHVNESVQKAVSEEDLDQILGQLVHDDEQYANVQEPAEMDRFIYGNCTHAMFTKIKKLKALSKSSNENEAFLAYRLSIKLCKKYGLEFDKIPCVVE